MAASVAGDAVNFAELPAGNQRKIGVAELNVPQSLNSLTTEMVEILLRQLQRWERDKNIACVLITGAGEKAFCAGGDVQALRNSSIANPGGPCVEAETFFACEYRLDYVIHTYNKPVIVWGDGIVMGGGLGIFAGGSHRVVTETSRFAMPEVTIGLYPDVGGSFFLNQMPGKTGRFLALTGASFNAADAFYTGVADFFIQCDQFDAVLAELQRAAPSTNAETSQLLAPFASQSVEAMPLGNVESHFDIINELCGGVTIEAVLKKLATLQTDDKWLLKAQKSVAHGSPLSVLLIDAQLSRSVGKPLVSVFREELVLSTNIVRYPEFAEGVRALLVDKDQQPKWQFPDIASVPKTLIESFFVLNFRQEFPVYTVLFLLRSKVGWKLEKYKKDWGASL